MAGNRRLTGTKRIILMQLQWASLTSLFFKPGDYVLYYFVVGKWHLSRTIGDLDGIFTLLFKKIKDTWVIVSDHSS